MSCTVGESAAQNTAAIKLQNDRMTVSILPAAGGNISALTDRRSGRNWLWQNPHIPISDIRAGDDYGRYLDSGGWDEILLSVSPDQILLSGVGKHDVADHGDLVRQRWTANARTDEIGNDVCETIVAGDVLDYEFCRILTLRRDDPRIDIEYRLSNRENFAIPWYWCAHVLLDVQPDMRINLPDDLPFRVEGYANQFECGHRWPTSAYTHDETFDLSQSFAVDGAVRPFASKLFVQAPEDGTVSVDVLDSDECLTMRFDPEILPWLGLWINNRGWSGCGSEPYMNLGLEPATTPYDKVSEAIANDAVRWLQPGGTCRWTLSVELAT